MLSGDINLEKKKEIVKLWFDTYQIDLNLRKKTGEDLLALASKNNLYDYIVDNCMREDWSRWKVLLLATYMLIYKTINIKNIPVLT